MRKLSIGLLAALALAGCTHKPMIEPSFPGFQPELTSTQQWRKLAAETAAQMMATLGTIRDQPAYGHLLGSDGLPPMLARRPVYVAVIDDRALFLKGFRDLLNAELTAQGYIVAASDDVPGAVIVNTWARVVPFSGGDRYRPGLLTAAAGLGYLGHQSLKWSVAQAAAVAVPVALLADAYVYLTDTPNAEVMITTAIADETRYLFQKTTIYYADVGDLGLYASYVPRAPIPTVTRGAAPARAGVTVAMPLVGPPAVVESGP